MQSHCQVGYLVSRFTLFSYSNIACLYYQFWLIKHVYSSIFNDGFWPLVPYDRLLRFELTYISYLRCETEYYLQLNSPANYQLLEKVRWRSRDRSVHFKKRMRGTTLCLSLSHSSPVTHPAIRRLIYDRINSYHVSDVSHRDDGVRVVIVAAWRPKDGPIV